MSSALNVFIKLLISQYFNNSKCINYFDNEETSVSFENIQFVNHGIKNIEDMKLLENCDEFFIISQEPRAVLDIIEWKLKHENYSRYNNERKYLIYSKSDDLNHLFSSRSLKYIENFLVFKSTHSNSLYKNMVEQENVTYKLFTNKYSGLEEYSPNLIDIWYSQNESFCYNNNLYPVKVANKQAKSLTVSTFPYHPYSNPNDKIGSEISLVLEYAKKYNFTLRVNNDLTWGTVTRNFSGTGVLGSVIKDESDIGFSAIFAWYEKHNYFDYSNVFVETGVTCIVPSPRILVAWRSLFPNFKIKLRFSFLITNCLLCLILVLTKIIIYERQRNSINAFQTLKIVEDSVFTVIKTVLLQPLKKPVKNLLTKLVVLQLFAVSLMMSSLYSSGLSSSLTIPEFIGEIDTVRELVESNIRWIAQHTDAWVESIYSAENEDYIKLVKSFKEVSKKNVIYRRDQAYAIERLPSGYFAIDDEIITPDVLKSHHAMKENLYTGKCVFVFRKNSVLLPSFNELLLRTLESGLGLHWERNAVFKYSNIQTQTAVKYNFLKKAQRHQISVLHIHGIVIVWSIGLAISLICLVVEISYYKYFVNKQ